MRSALRLLVIAVFAFGMVAILGLIGAGPPRPDGTSLASIASNINGPSGIRIHDSVSIPTAGLTDNSAVANNLSLPASLASPHSLQAVTTAGSQVTFTCTSAPASLNCGEQVAITVSVKDSTDIALRNQGPTSVLLRGATDGSVRATQSLSTVGDSTNNTALLNLRHGDNSGLTGGNAGDPLLLPSADPKAVVEGAVASSWLSDPVQPVVRTGSAGLANDSGTPVLVYVAAGVAVFALAGLASLKFATRR